MKNNKIFKPEDKINPENVDVWVEYFQKMRKHEDKNMNGEDVDGLNFGYQEKMEVPGHIVLAQVEIRYLKSLHHW